MVFVGLCYSEYQEYEGKLEFLKYTYLYHDILIKFDTIFSKAIYYGLDFYIDINNTYQFTSEMKKESCIIQVLYNYPYNKSNLIVLYCHVFNCPIPTLTLQELSLVFNKPISEFNEILEIIDIFMNQNHSDHEIQYFIKKTRQEYFNRKVVGSIVK